MSDGRTGPTMVRLARSDDAAGVLGIYGPVVRETAISFEIEVPSPAEISRRIERTLVEWPWLVGEVEGGIAGYAYASAHRARAAYRWTAETSVYVHADHRGRGVGRQLYTVLLDVLRSQGVCNAIAGTTLPNPASVRLHESAGFSAIGVCTAIGYKIGRWHDVQLWEQRLVEDAAPGPLRPLAEIRHEVERRLASWG